jgi:hypothetical protein
MDYSEGWIERTADGAYEFCVRLPYPDADPMEFLTPAMEHLIRPGDSLTVYLCGAVGRSAPSLQLDRPPARRKPWRLVGDRQFEIMDESGQWVRGEWEGGIVREAPGGLD